MPTIADPKSERGCCGTGSSAPTSKSNVAPRLDEPLLDNDENGSHGRRSSGILGNDRDFEAQLARELGTTKEDITLEPDEPEEQEQNDGDDEEQDDGEGDEEDEEEDGSGSGSEDGSGSEEESEDGSEDEEAEDADSPDNKKDASTKQASAANGSDQSKEREEKKPSKRTATVESNGKSAPAAADSSTANNDQPGAAAAAAPPNAFKPAAWQCTACRWRNGEAASQCAMCFLPKPSAAASKVKFASTSDTNETPGTLYIQLIKGMRILDGNETGSLFAVFCMDKPSIPAKDASTHSHASKLTKTSKAHPHPVWNEDIKNIILKTLRDRKLFIHVFSKDLKTDLNTHIGFGEVKLDHPMLRLEVDEMVKKVEVPLKVRKPDGTAARLMRGAEAASVSVYLFFTRNEVRGSPFSDAAFSSSSSNLNKVAAGPSSAAPAWNRPKTLMLSDTRAQAEEAESQRQMISKIPFLRNLSVAAQRAKQQQNDAGAQDEEDKNMIMRDPTTKFRIDDDSGGGVTRMRSTTFDMPRPTLDELADTHTYLHVTLVEARNLMHIFDGDILYGSTSPYVVLRVAKPVNPADRNRFVNEYRPQEKKSSVVKRTTNPVYNEEIGPFDVTALNDERLYIEVHYAAAEPGENTCIGKAEIKLSSPKLDLTSGEPRNLIVPLKDGRPVFDSGKQIDTEKGPSVTLTLRLETPRPQQSQNLASEDYQ